MELDRIAFILGHPSSVRRVSFALAECVAEIQEGYEYGYGRPYVPEREDLPAGMAFIPGVNSVSSSDLATPQKAIAAVEPLFQAAISDVYGDLVQFDFSKIGQ